MTKKTLIANLTDRVILKTPTIIEAFKNVDRADFVLPEYKEMAYFDQPLPIGSGQTISQPLTVALMLEWLAPKKGEKILDVGCGSGWTTALLASILGKEGKVIGIERIPELAEFARQNLSKYLMFQRTSTVMQEDGTKGYAKEAPFDKILASAAAYDRIPPAWKDQLKVGGRIVAPVKDSVVVIDKLLNNEFQQIDHWGFAFVPLISESHESGRPE